jgi:hypothetical protein
MSLPPITLQLSKFEQLEILRLEIETREEELRNIEKSIRQILWELERQKYLKSLSPFFEQLTLPEEAARLPDLEAYRVALGDAIETIRAGVAALEKETKDQVPPPKGNMPSRFGPRKAGFDSFEDFRSQRKSGGKP